MRMNDVLFFGGCFGLSILPLLVGMVFGFWFLSKCKKGRNRQKKYWRMASILLLFRGTRRFAQTTMLFRHWWMIDLAPLDDNPPQFSSSRHHLSRLRSSSWYDSHYVLFDGGKNGSSSGKTVLQTFVREWIRFLSWSIDLLIIRCSLGVDELNFTPACFEMVQVFRVVIIFFLLLIVVIIFRRCVLTSFCVGILFFKPHDNNNN